MGRQLVMLRHGQTDYNANHRMQGQLDTQLSSVGIEQARSAAKYVGNLNIVKIVSSDLTRAKDTADIIANTLGLDVTIDARLRETDLGHWQGRTHEEVDSEYVGARAAWRHNPGWAPPGGESRLEVARRARPAIDELMASFPDWEGQAVLIVAHGGTISALTSNLLGLAPTQYPLLSGLKNTNTSQLTARPRFTEGTMNGDFTAENHVDAQWYLDAWNQGWSS
ncbi:histidine phosphatase family protein [Corynebacterium lubricantis]|uniref:histidine phosphatase family protein n=1 Tax=Corynebacterium lubricantis TaxID=541095 RepID=UPI000477B60D|nr:histidine phosphatase family protein [Corynebacterium lubricantis]